MNHDAIRLTASVQALPQRRHTDRRRTASVAQPPLLDHYPTLLIDTWHLRDGTRITQRPVLPQDGPLLGELMQRLSALAKRQRLSRESGRVSTSSTLSPALASFFSS